MYVTLSYTQRTALAVGERSKKFIVYKFMKDYGQKRVTKFYIHLVMSPVSQGGSTVVKVLCYKSEGRWFDPSRCQWNFSLT